MELTHSIEDYLEAIWIISLEKKVVRVKDIMKLLGYKVSSVNNALKTLAQKNLIEYERYGYIDMTPQGAEIAQKIYNKHKMLHNFFTNVLGVEDEVSKIDACNIEHYISNSTFEKLFAFINFIETECEGCYEKWNEFKNKGGKKMKLSNLLKEERGVIKEITANSSMKQRFLSMGIVPGEIITVEKVAPLGDPIDFLLKNSHLSLRKSEADSIIIEKV